MATFLYFILGLEGVFNSKYENALTKQRRLKLIFIPLFFCSWRVGVYMHETLGMIYIGKEKVFDLKLLLRRSMMFCHSSQTVLAS